MLRKYTFSLISAVKGRLKCPLLCCHDIAAELKEILWWLQQNKKNEKLHLTAA